MTALGSALASGWPLPSGRTSWPTTVGRTHSPLYPPSNSLNGRLAVRGVQAGGVSDSCSASYFGTDQVLCIGTVCLVWSKQASRQRTSCQRDIPGAAAIGSVRTAGHCPAHLRPARLPGSKALTVRSIHFMTLLTFRHSVSAQHGARNRRIRMRSYPESGCFPRCRFLLANS